MDCSLYCQVCRTDFPKVFAFKKHLLSLEHQLKMIDTFQKDTMRSGFIPTIVFVDPQTKSAINEPVVGLSLLTMCFSSTCTSFYLCHVCEQHCPVKNILSHIFSQDHYSNYFNYTNPNNLSFSWIAGMNMRAALRPKLRGTEDVLWLQMLQLPVNLVDQLNSKTYSEAMQILSENDRLIKLFEATQPKRTTIHAYQNSSSRKHPLLGMQHLVECICLGPGEKRHYLCTLCRLTVASHAIIKHVLSFDHIYCYFKAWHPSTLLSKESYRDYKFLAPMMLDFAKQTEEIHATRNASMKEVSLKPNEFKAVDFTCYTEALKKLESITKSSLTTNIEPGNRLEYHAAVTHPTSSVKHKCKFCCQSCRHIYDSIFTYQKHLSSWKHEQMLQKYFGKAEGSWGYDMRGKVYLGLFAYVRTSWRRNKPVVGTAMVVTCINACGEAEPICLCFACVDAFPQSSVEQHFESQKHLINVLLYQNPWRLPFAWEEELDEDILRSMALEEERERKQDQIVLKIFDIPPWIFWNLDNSDYRRVLHNLQHHSAILKREVPPCETFSKLQENEKFPLLGRQFMVTYDLFLEGVASLCLLCVRKLSSREAEAHVFSREHVTRFLDLFHPGSLDSITVDAETLMDLAKQAACIHAPSNVQKVKPKKPIWETDSYHKAMNSLAYEKKRERKGNLKPPITPMKKLVPRKKSGMGKMDQNLKKDGENNSSNAERQEREKKEETSDGRKTPTPKEKQLKTQKEASPTTCQKEIKTADEASQEINGKAEKPKTEKPSEEVKKTCQNTEENNGATSRTEGHSSIKHIPTPLSNIPKQGDKKRPRSLTEGSQEDTCPDEHVGSSLKRRRLCSKDDTSSEESTEIPKSGAIEEMTAEWETSCDEVVVKAVHTLKDHNLWPVGVCELSSTSSPSCVKPVNGSAALDDSVKVADMKSDNSENCAAATAETSAITKPTTKTSKVSKSADNSPTCSVGPRSEDASSISVSKSRTNKADLLPDCINNGCDASVSKCATTESFKMETSKRKEVAASIRPATTSKCTTTSSKLAESTSASCAAVSNLTSGAKSATMARPQERRSGTSSQGKQVSRNGSPAPQTKPTVIQEATYRTTPPSKNNALRCAETASKDLVTPQTEITSVAAIKIPQVSAKPANNDPPKTLNEKNSVEANVQERNPPAAPHLKSERSEHIKPNQETSNVSTSKATTNAECFKVGLSYLIVVLWKQKQQVYCLLCLVRLNSSSHHHLMSLRHRYNYVKRRYPEWSAKPLELESKLQQTVALLAAIEKNMPNSRTIQKKEVEMNIYQKLGGLPEVEAVEFVKKMMKRRISSSAVNDNAEASLRLEVSSPCEVSSSDDGIVQSETGLPTDNQSEQEDKNQHRTPLTQIADVESSSKEKENLTADQLIEDPPASDLIQSPFQSCTSFSQVTPDSTPSPDIQVKTITDTIQQIQSYAEIQPQVNVTHATKSHGVTVEKSGPTSQRPQKYLESEEKSSPGQTSSRNLQAPKHSLSPGNLSASQALTGTSVGKKAKGCSNLSFYLKASQQDNKAVIGMGSVWECRGNSLKTFYLCECCEEILSRCDICQHMVSFDHQFRYVRKEHPDLLQKFWFEEDVPHFMKMEIFLKIVVHELSKREHFFKVDAQCILLESEWHEVVRTVPISKALQIVQSIRNEEKPSFFHRPLIATEQKSRHHEDQQRDDRSLPIERLSAQAHKTNQRRNSAGQRRDRMYTVAGLEVKGASSHLDRSYSPVKAESVSPVPIVGTCFTPQDTCSGLSLQPELKPAVSQLTKSDPLVHVKKEVAFESASLATISSTISRNPEAAPRNECPLSRKRPADTSEDRLPAKYISSPVQVKTEPSFQSASDFSSVNPAPGGYGTYQTANYTVKQMYSQQSHGHYLATGISPPWESLETQQEQKYCHYWASRSQSNH
ncbi:uncharacterized protein LOC121628194 isoform X3 [Melanotaenia boesemani]|uniref:uncharacterized protein LOC121628194 isoform X3 n=1 Tax=Melanotaenia boesemani TaxID=1250792 RepID=UPI001C045E86|nr:uncharacterized protein LOC121628194 isoform X3 [Melanotaenia boesemani]